MQKKETNIFFLSKEMPGGFYEANKVKTSWLLLYIQIDEFHQLDKKIMLKEPVQLYLFRVDLLQNQPLWASLDQNGHLRDPLFEHFYEEKIHSYWNFQRQKGDQFLLSHLRLKNYKNPISLGMFLIGIH